MNEDEENLDEEGLDDPYESELKKEKEAENKRIEDAKDDLTEGKIRRARSRRGQGGDVKQLDIPGLFEARSGLRTTAALGTEIFLNTLVDPVLEPGTQVAAGTAINWLAQRIRGGELSKGELAAAGLASLIPGGAQGRAITQFAKGSAKGALSGAIETAGMAGIDQGRLPTAEELAAGIGIGAAFGGAISTPQATKALQEIRDRVKGKFTPITVYASEGTFRNLPRDTGDNYKEFIDITTEASEFRNLPAEQQERLSKFVRGRLKSTDWEDLGLAAKYEATGEFDQGDWDRYVQAVRKNEDDVYTLITILNKIETDQAIKSGDIKEIGRRMADLFTVGESPLDRRRALDAFTESDLQKIIDNEGGFIEFRTDRMARENSLPYIIRDVGDLSAAVRRRLDEIAQNPYFEFGHQKAALNVLLDNNAANRANYLNNALPEPARSIIETRFEGNDLDDLLDNGFEGVVVEPGNRSTQAAEDLDPNINKMFGTAEDVEESFLNFMRPQFDVANEFPVNLRQNIIDDYTEELGIIAEDLAQYGVDVNNSTFDFSNLNRSKFKEVLNKYRTGNIPLYRILEIEETQRLFREFPELAEEFLTVRPGSSGNYAINYLSNRRLTAQQAALLKSLKKEIDKLGTPFTKRPRKPITKRATEGGKYNLDGSKRRRKKFNKKKDDDDDNLAPV